MASDSTTSFCIKSDGITPYKLRTYQVVVAASKNLGLGKDLKMAWDLPLEYEFFLTITRITNDPTKRNAVIMGRKTWDATPLEHRPHVGVLNVVLTRSSENLNIPTSQNVVICKSLISALELLAASPYCESIEKVFLIGGGEILNDSLNARECDAIHLTEIDAEIECDTFIPAVDTCVFQPWYSSFPTVENKLRYSFITYVRVKKSSAANYTNAMDQKNNGAEINNFSFLPEMILQRHEEYMYLRLVQDIISNGTLKLKDDNIGKCSSTLSKFGCQMRFNLRKSFPLLTTKKVFWQGVVEELLCYISGSRSTKVDTDLRPIYGFLGRHFVASKYIDTQARCSRQGSDHRLLDDAINKIKNNPPPDHDDRPIILSAAWINPSDFPLFLQLYVANGELSCQMYHHSADMYLGVPFYLAYYALLTCMIAHVCDLVPGDFVHVIGDAHVYCTHIRALEDQIQKQPKPFPILKIKCMEKDINSFVSADFDLLGYDHY